MHFPKSISYYHHSVDKTEALKFNNLFKVTHSGTRSLILFCDAPGLSCLCTLSRFIQVMMKKLSLIILLALCTAINFHTLRLFCYFRDWKAEEKPLMFCSKTCPDLKVTMRLVRSWAFTDHRDWELLSKPNSSISLALEQSRSN